MAEQFDLRSSGTSHKLWRLRRRYGLIDKQRKGKPVKDQKDGSGGEKAEDGKKAKTRKKPEVQPMREPKEEPKEEEDEEAFDGGFDYSDDDFEA